jgi:hypothetical protein
MRNLGTLGGPFAIAFSVNTHRRVVGSSVTADDLLLPFLWTAGGGMRPLPTLGGDFGEAIYMNEFGAIAGRTTNARGGLRATLWIPTPGPLLASLPEEVAEPEVSGPAGTASSARVVSCAAVRSMAYRSHFDMAAGRACPSR